MGIFGVESRGGICEKRGCWVLEGFASLVSRVGVRRRVSINFPGVFPSGVFPSVRRVELEPSGGITPPPSVLHT